MYINGTVKKCRVHQVGN